MDTVLGLSLTSTAVGWVLVEGRAADGTIVDHEDFEVHAGGGVRAVEVSQRATEAVLHAQAATARHDQRLHVIGVTWSDDAAAEAALLQESLTDAGFHNLVPIRLQQAADMLAQGIAPVVGYEKAAVCVLDSESTTVVMVDSSDGDTQTAVKHLSGGADRLSQWLVALFDRGSWRPDGVVVVGADNDLDSLSWQLEKVLPVPVITQSGAQLALARGAAMAAAQCTEFTDDDILETTGRTPVVHQRSRQPSHAGAWTMLVAGAVTLVASLALAVGPRLMPEQASAPVHHAVHKAASPPIAQAPPLPPAPVEVPAARPAPEPTPIEEPQVSPTPVEQQGVSAAAPAAAPAAEPVPPPPPPQPVPPPEPPPNPHPLLTRVLERLHGHQDDPAQQPPVPPQVPPPNPGAPPP
ncbi:hypothetical protein H7K24_11635 [Mycobacterium fragae]|uniref:DUF7159 family protein n=1 Tax=Mycobacterium fragae TaxID=1260918 RepID=UPI000A159582|nr:hypothetical protein [Mycobacterium fragae]MCV7400806.1 hypothetical protein [Mycobacterium fragae]